MSTDIASKSQAEQRFTAVIVASFQAVVSPFSTRVFGPEWPALTFFGWIFHKDLRARRPAWVFYMLRRAQDCSTEKECWKKKTHTQIFIWLSIFRPHMYIYIFKNLIEPDRKMYKVRPAGLHNLSPALLAAVRACILLESLWICTLPQEMRLLIWWAKSLGHADTARIS